MASITLKNIPEAVLKRLRVRAAINHRSAQAELRAMLGGVLEPKRLSLADLQERVKVIGLRTPSESTQMIRRARKTR